MAQLNVRPVEGERNTKPRPDFSSFDPKLKTAYESSKDGTDSNLLVLIHGIGDTLQPLLSLALSLNLPQTAILAIQGPLPLPYMDQPSFMWMPSFDLLTGEVIENADPTKAIALISRVLESLSTTSSWPPGSIHLYGFGQGASIALETALHCSATIGSVVSVSGGLLSLPMVATPSPVPIMLWKRQSDRTVNAGWLKKAFADCVIHESTVENGPPLPRSAVDWRPVFEFWNTWLRRLDPWDVGRGEVFEVVRSR